MTQQAVREICQDESYIANKCQPDATLSLLTRLSQKPGVQSTLVLSRDTGAIVRISGLISESTNPNPNSNNTLLANGDTALNGAAYGDEGKDTKSGLSSAEGVAQMVYKFVQASGDLVEGLQPDDEVKLLRVRTKKNELVIVPGEYRREEYHCVKGKKSKVCFL